MFRGAIAGLLLALSLAAATPLHDAVWQGDLPAVIRLLDGGTPVDSRHPEGGSTPLHYAVLRGDTALAKLLIERHADPNAANNNGATALHLAARRRDVALTRLLLDAHADPARADANGLTPLGQAAQAGAPDVVAALLDRTSDPGPALALASDPATAQVLLDRGHYTPGQLSVALTRAAALRSPELARSLLTHRADPQSALQIAVRQGDPDLVRILLEAGAKPEAQLYEAALRGDAAVIRLLVRYGAPVNQRDAATGTTPLYAAAGLGYLEAVAALLELGADPSLTAPGGRTPLQAAQSGKFEPVADLLKKIGN